MSGSRTTLCALAPIVLLASGPAPAAGVFRAGAHRVEITPDTFPITISGGFLAVGAERAAAPLYARALALDDGRLRVVIAVVDTLMMPREFLDQVKQAASRATGIPPERMLISATHTHSAPALMGALGTDVNLAYVEFVRPRILAAIQGAVERLEPARVGWSVVQAPDHTHCRRWILRPDKIRQDPFGQLTVRANMHPGYQNPDFLGPAGPVDPDLTLLAFQRPDGAPLALLANYSMHYVGATGRVVSPDYYGPFAAILSRLIAGDAPRRPFLAVMSQGTSGDLHWMDYSRPKQQMNPELYAETLARLASQAYQRIRYRAWAPLDMAETTLKLRRRTPDPQRLAWAKEILARLGGQSPRNLAEVYAREQVLLHEEPERELKLQALRIGELAIAAIPNEVFAITGLKIKSHSPLHPSFVITLANGAEGYIPPPEQHRLGGYVTWPARTAGLQVEAEPKIVETVLQLLEKLSGKPRRQINEPHGAYARAVLSARPLAYWRLSELSEPAARDATSRRNHALYEGRFALYLEGPPSPAFSGNRLNRAPQFAGGRLKANLPALGDRYTLEMWFFNALPYDARPIAGYLFCRGQERLGLGGAARAAARLFFASGDAWLEGPTPIPLRSWNYLALVRDTNGFALYLNGRQTPEMAARVPPAPALATAFIAGCEDGQNGFEGRIDEVAVYDRPLPARQIAAHFAAAALRPN